MSLADQARNKSRPFDRGIELLDRVDYRLAETEEERDEIYRLRYRAYLNEGAIEPNREHRITDRFDDLPNSWIFGVYYEGVLTSSIRISVATPAHPETPSMDVFPDLLRPEIDRGKIVVDPTRFVADPARANLFMELPYLTLRLAYVACEYFHADLGLASVRTEHQAFYRRVFMHMISPARDYPGLTKPISLMVIDFQAMRDKIFARYPYLRSSYFERRMLFERSSTPRLAPPLELPEFPFIRATIVPRS
jgi:N-acyl-L-homoserine lactone synthetase